MLASSIYKQRRSVVATLALSFVAFHSQCRHVRDWVLLLQCVLPFISLMEASYHGHLECVKLLVLRGASWLTRDHAGEANLPSPSPIHLHAHSQIVSYLIHFSLPLQLLYIHTLHHTHTHTHIHTQVFHPSTMQWMEVTSGS